MESKKVLIGILTYLLAFGLGSWVTPRTVVVQRPPLWKLGHEDTINQLKAIAGANLYEVVEKTEWDAVKKALDEYERLAITKQEIDRERKDLIEAREKMEALREGLKYQEYQIWEKGFCEGYEAAVIKKGGE